MPCPSQLHMSSATLQVAVVVVVVVVVVMVWWWWWWWWWCFMLVVVEEVGSRTFIVRRMVKMTTRLAMLERRRAGRIPLPLLAGQHKPCTNGAHHPSC